MTTDPRFVITIVTLGIIVFDSGYLIWYLNRQNAPVRTNVVKMIGVILLVPLIFLLSLWDKIESQTVATILGAFVGYVFGHMSIKEEWENK